MKVLQAQVTELKAANEELQQKLAASDEEVTNLKKSNNKLERLNKTLDTEKVNVPMNLCFPFLTSPFLE